MIRFSLKKGMTDLSVLDALLTGQGAFDGTGETSETILDMFDRVEDQLAFEHCNTVKGAGPSLCVAKCTTKYAILRHDRKSYVGDTDGWTYTARPEQSEHYIAGINDEGRYFVRPLGNIAQDKLAGIESAVDWLNRADRGFWRIQGDLVVKFVSYRNNRLAVAGRKRTTFMFRLGISANDGDAVEEMAAKNNDFSRPLMHLRQDDFLHNERRFGNHSVVVQGWPEEVIVSPAFDGPIMEPMVVQGDELELHHIEHDTVYAKIPKNHYAILVSQRGGRPITRQSGREAWGD